MQNVILLIHLLLTLTLIIVVLLQRSEGGGLGMGGGGGNMPAGRSAGTALGKMTWFLGFALFATSISLTVIAAQNSAGSSVLDRITDTPPPVEAPVEDSVPGLGGDLLPPSAGDTAPLTPTAD
jgi:preprotein translocase subunit SecG